MKFKMLLLLCFGFLQAQAGNILMVTIDNQTLKKIHFICSNSSQPYWQANRGEGTRTNAPLLLNENQQFGFIIDHKGSGVTAEEVLPSALRIPSSVRRIVFAYTLFEDRNTFETVNHHLSEDNLKSTNLISVYMYDDINSHILTYNLEIRETDIQLLGTSNLDIHQIGVKSKKSNTNWFSYKKIAGLGLGAAALYFWWTNSKKENKKK